MLQLGALAFLEPWLLLAFAALPAIWLLLRLTPPAPKRIAFPAIRFLLGLKPKEETPAKTPWWLLLLRMVMVALIVLAAAGPVLNPAEDLDGSGPLILVVDDGWAAAPRWQARLAVARDYLNRAERGERTVRLLTTAPSREATVPAISGLLTAAEARDRIEELEPKPWPVNREAALASIEAADIAGAAHVVWLSDGLAGARDRAFAEVLQRLGRLDVRRPEAMALPKRIVDAENAADGLQVQLARVQAGESEAVSVSAFGADGRLIARLPATFEAGAAEAAATFDLPSDLRNEIGSLAIDGARTAAATLLLDERWRRRPVGLYAGAARHADQPLLGEIYYLRRALGPFAELREFDDLSALEQRALAVLVLADVPILDEAERAAVRDWVEAGGLLLRFAGPRLARSLPAAGQPPVEDALLPVDLRAGDRILGGAMTWGDSAPLAAFSQNGPFAGLAVPSEVTVSRQVLAQPSLDLGDKTWARLADGTPLVTAAREGRGWTVLVHTSANPTWSNLSLSGLFVEMLRRLVDFSDGVTGLAADEPVGPLSLLDGFGRLGQPWNGARTLDLERDAGSLPRPENPPGYYGRGDVRHAHNLGPALSELAPLGTLPAGVSVDGFAASEERGLRAWLLAVVLILMLADLLISLGFRGLLRPARRATATAGVVLALGGVLAAAPAMAQLSDEQFAQIASTNTHLAYVQTGVPSVDRVSQAGLAGLSRVLFKRTSVEPGPPMAVRPGDDPLVFFPLIYWPVTAEQRAPDAAAVGALNDYLANGGTIFFDLRDSGYRGQTGTLDASVHLRRLTAGIDIPALQPVPPDHVLTKAFYLLQDFPGRKAGGTLWVERVGEQSRDGVASVIAGGNDWAAAWALNDNGTPMFPVVPGGERQREQAYRFGVNLVMYALTGNYKADQVHVPFILERLGQ